MVIVHGLEVEDVFAIGFQVGWQPLGTEPLGESAPSANCRSPPIVFLFVLALLVSETSLPTHTLQKNWFKKAV